MSELIKIQENLKKEIPFKWRVQSFSKKKPQATCVAYIDSRDVQDVLDANCLWSDRYYEQNGMLFCEITIYADGREYKRSDTGSESQSDAEKGHSSDAFKRAAVKFGVGRFLYSQPIQYLPANEVKTNNNYPYVVDNSGKRIWDITTHINKGLGKTTPIEPKQEPQKVWINQKQVQKAIDEGLETIKKTLDFYDGKTVRDNKIYCMSKEFKLSLETALKV
jgi:hypothetical protein